MTPAVSVRVPGKVMLAGEYVVLAGGQALATTVDRHLTVRLRPRPGIGACMVASDLWRDPRRVTEADEADGEPLVAAVAHGMKRFGVTDCELRVDSELDVRFGLGSSSALRLGVLLALQEWARHKAGLPALRGREELWDTARAAYQLQRQSQSRASGYDVATQLVGGLVRFAMGDGESSWPQHLERIVDRRQAALPRLVHLFVGGAGAPTGGLVRSTVAWLAEDGRAARLATLDEELHRAFDEALAGPEASAGRRRLCQAIGAQRQFFAEAPAFPRALARELERLPGCDETWSFKTTGAGGEDALLFAGLEPDLADIARALKTHGWTRLVTGFETAGTRIVREERYHER